MPTNSDSIHDRQKLWDATLVLYNAPDTLTSASINHYHSCVAPVLIACAQLCIKQANHLEETAQQLSPSLRNIYSDDITAISTILVSIADTANWLREYCDRSRVDVFKLEMESNQLKLQQQAIILYMKLSSPQFYEEGLRRSPNDEEILKKVYHFAENIKDPLPDNSNTFAINFNALVSRHHTQRLANKGSSSGNAQHESRSFFQGYVDNTSDFIRERGISSENTNNHKFPHNTSISHSTEEDSSTMATEQQLQRARVAAAEHFCIDITNYLVKLDFSKNRDSFEASITQFINKHVKAEFDNDTEKFYRGALITELCNKFTRYQERASLSTKELQDRERHESLLHDIHPLIRNAADFLVSVRKFMTHPFGSKPEEQPNYIAINLKECKNIMANYKDNVAQRNGANEKPKEEQQSSASDGLESNEEIVDSTVKGDDYNSEPETLHMLMLRNLTGNLLDHVESYFLDPVSSDEDEETANEDSDTESDTKASGSENDDDKSSNSGNSGNSDSSDSDGSDREDENNDEGGNLTSSSEVAKADSQEPDAEASDDEDEETASEDSYTESDTEASGSENDEDNSGSSDNDDSDREDENNNEGGNLTSSSKVAKADSQEPDTKASGSENDEDNSGSSDNDDSDKEDENNNEGGNLTSSSKVAKADSQEPDTENSDDEDEETASEDSDTESDTEASGSENDEDNSGSSDNDDSDREDENNNEGGNLTSSPNLSKSGSQEPDAENSDDEDEETASEDSCTESNTDASDSENDEDNSGSSDNDDSDREDENNDEGGNLTSSSKIAKAGSKEPDAENSDDEDEETASEDSCTESNTDASDSDNNDDNNDDDDDDDDNSNISDNSSSSDSGSDNDASDRSGYSTSNSESDQGRSVVTKKTNVYDQEKQQSTPNMTNSSKTQKSASKKRRQTRRELFQEKEKNLVTTPRITPLTMRELRQLENPERHDCLKSENLDAEQTYILFNTLLTSFLADTKNPDKLKDADEVVRSPKNYRSPFDPTDKVRQIVQLLNVRLEERHDHHDKKQKILEAVDGAILNLRTVYAGKSHLNGWIPSAAIADTLQFLLYHIEGTAYLNRFAMQYRSQQENKTVLDMASLKQTWHPINRNNYDFNTVLTNMKTTSKTKNRSRSNSDPKGAQHSNQRKHLLNKTLN